MGNFGQFIIRDAATNCAYTGGHLTLASARRAARKLVARYGSEVYIVATDGFHDVRTVERISDGAWR